MDIKRINPKPLNDLLFGLVVGAGFAAILVALWLRYGAAPAAILALAGLAFAIAAWPTPRQVQHQWDHKKGEL